ncbi:MAG TPA: hypothetical protein VKV28_01410 [Candidatus Binataceae bacterium]|nr:hypothetical protein [Candidatus Binataceae bacterium]
MDRKIFLPAWLLLAVVPILLLAGCGGSSSNNSANSANALLQGTCIWQSLSLATAQSSAGPATILSPLTFDGAGHVRFDYYANINGTFSTTPNVTGTYQMNASGHGSMSYVSPASGALLTFDLYMMPGGKGVRTILKSYQNQAPSPRVSKGSCQFDE